MMTAGAGRCEKTAGVEDIDEGDTAEFAVKRTVRALIKDSGKLVVDEVEQPEQAASTEEEVGPTDDKSGEASRVEDDGQ
jgi:hypothetical protein